MPEREPRAEATDGAVPCSAPPALETHDLLRLALVEAARRLQASVEDLERFPAARDHLVRFCFTELLPHLEADEGWLLEARHCVHGRLIADAIRTEARAMTAAVYELADATGPCEAVAATRVIHAFLAAHTHHEQLLVVAGAHTAVPARDP